MLGGVRLTCSTSSPRQNKTPEGGGGALQRVPQSIKSLSHQAACVWVLNCRCQVVDPREPKKRDKEGGGKGWKPKLFQWTEAASSTLLASRVHRWSWRWRFLGQRSGGWRGWPLFWKTKEAANLSSVPSRSLSFPDLGQVLSALGSSSCPPRAAFSCWEAPLLPTLSWGRSPRRTPTPQCLWSWCTVCCQRTDSWPGAEWSPSPFPGRGLRCRRNRRRRGTNQ